MHKSNIVVIASIVIIVIGYFSYLGIKEREDNENIFTRAQSANIKPIIKNTENQTFYQYNKSPFNFESFPVEVQKNIIKEQLNNHTKIMAVLKDYLVRYHVYLTTDEAKTRREIRPEDIPPLFSYLKTIVTNKRVLEVYEKNKEKFSKNHDPEKVKKQIYFKLLSQEGYKFIQSFLAEAYYKNDLELAASPKIPKEWLELKSAHTYGDKSSPHHLIWIGQYGCKRCPQIISDLGALYKKWGKGKMKLSFMPWAKNDLDAYQYINIAGLCLLSETSQKEYWQFHSTAMAASEEISHMKEENLKLALSFIESNLKEIGISLETIERVNKCTKVKASQNKYLIQLIKDQNEISFIPNMVTPLFIFNGRLLDLEGRKLLHALNSEITRAETPAP